MTTRKSVRILGIDPALNNTGWTILDFQGNDPIFVSMGHISNKQKTDYYVKLANIRSSIVELVQKYQPQVLSIEETFVNTNARSSLKLGIVRGVIISVALEYGLEVKEFEPSEIKKAITGTGRAEKEQVSYMAKVLVPQASPQTLDESDSLAIALCGGFSLNNV